MNKAYIEGFTKKAKEAGLTTVEAHSLLKDAGVDPAQLAATSGAGAAPGASPTGDPSAGGPPGQGPDPSQMGGGADGMAAGGGGMGVPPELEQMLQSLPPEVLQQLVQEIQGELGNGGGDPSGGAGGPPPPPHGGGHHKAGSAMIAKQAEYIEGFMERGLANGFNTQSIKELYKRALDIFEGGNTQERETAKPKQNEKRAAHYEGFVERAVASGISKQEAHKTYLNVYGNR